VNWQSVMTGDAPATLGFVHGGLDRAAHLRSNQAALDALAQHPDARFYAFCGENAVLMRQGEALEPLFSRAGLPQPEAQQETLFLGLDDAAPRFAVILDPDVTETLQAHGDFCLVGLRQLALERPISPQHLGAMAQGKALAHWHSRHRFCSNCGAPTALSQGGWRRDCAACAGQHFPRTDPVVIMLTIDGDYCLMGRQPRFPAGVYSSLAGFVEPGETIEAAVRRETLEEAGISTGRVHLIANQPWPFPASLMIGAFAEALSRDIMIDREELEDCRWFHRDEVRAMMEKRHTDGLIIPPRMAIAHHLIRHWVETI
jgi:NAD+ diphosphatase